MPSYYVPDLTVQTKQISIVGEEFHHLSRVARHRPGDEITLNTGKGIIARAKILAIDGCSANLRIISAQAYTDHRPKYCLAFSLLQNRHDEWIVEKATELGCSVFYPLVCQRTIRVPSANTKCRFEKVALAASKQCDRPYLPKVMDVNYLESSLARIGEDGHKPIVLSERRPDLWLEDIMPQMNEAICILIGAEGGFSNGEYALFERLQIPLISVSSLILRAETAAIAAASQINLLGRIR